MVGLAPKLICALVVAVPELEVLVRVVDHAKLTGIIDEEAARVMVSSMKAIEHIVLKLTLALSGSQRIWDPPADCLPGAETW